MDALFSDEQRLFQRTVRAYLEKECAPSQIRAAGGAWSWERWKGLADLGVVGLTAPEANGGLGKDETDLVLILEEAGRAALPEPLAETAGVVVPALIDVGFPEMSAEWLDAIAAGEGIATIDRRERMTLESRNGDKTAMAMAGASIAGVDIATSDRAAFATAAVLSGIADRVIDMAATYAKERQQFGKAIGSFQAVKHLLADALLGLEFARPAVYRAAWSLAKRSFDVQRDVSMAKALASDAAFNACRSALQVHGAIGYTHEHDLHLWLTKGFALCNQWGTAAWHRERVAAVLSDRSPNRTLRVSFRRSE